MIDKAQKRVLIVSSVDKGFEEILSNLDEAKFSPVERAISAADARRRLSTSTWDIVFVNSPLSDESGIELSAHAAEDQYAGIILLVKAEFYDLVCRKVENFGVLVLQKPVICSSFHQALKLAVATRERLRNAEKRNEGLRKKMEEIRTVTRAKWLLIEKLGLSEPEAHRFIEKQAMDMRQTRQEIAEILIRTYEN